MKQLQELLTLLEAFENEFGHRPIRLIAKEIREDWKNIESSYAWPYYEAMADSNKITDMYGADDVYGIVLYFLSNAAGWKGEKAREIKKELKKMCNDYEKMKKGLSEEKDYSPYGKCPECDGKGVMRERRVNGYTTCENGHKCLSKDYPDCIK